MLGDKTRRPEPGTHSSTTTGFLDSGFVSEVRLLGPPTVDTRGGIDEDNHDTRGYTKAHAVAEEAICLAGQVVQKASGWWLVENLERELLMGGSLELSQLLAAMRTDRARGDGRGRNLAATDSTTYFWPHPSGEKPTSS